MSLVCGIDVGSPETLSYVAYLKDTAFYFDVYIPTREQPLPQLPMGWNERPSCILVDGPQSLPLAGRSRRKCDELANTPTRKLPGTRTELADTRLYRGLIQAGLDIFWGVYRQNTYHIPGLGEKGPIIAETYPRYILKQQFPDLDPIPSKRKEPEKYVKAIWHRLLAQGFRCESVLNPTVDQVDAALAALTALIFLNNGEPEQMQFGEQPVVDEAEEVIREGFLVAPYAH